MNAEQKAGRPRVHRRTSSETDNQKEVLKFGFRPGNPNVALDDPIIAANGVEPQPPQHDARRARPPVLARIITSGASSARGRRSCS